MKKAIIVGSGGQDGQLLQSFLSKQNYIIIAIDKNSEIDILKQEHIERIIKDEKPDEIYYLAAYHHSSQDSMPDNLILFQKSFETNLFGLLLFLETIRIYSSKTKLFYAASSHIFGSSNLPMQDETTPVNPVNVYGISKASALFTCRYYRQKYGIFVSVGILYNHESNLRKEVFLSKKVCSGVAKIKSGNLESLSLKSLDDVMDVGYAEDFIFAMHSILALSESDDFIIATGEKHSVRDFIKIAFSTVGLDYKNFVVGGENNPVYNLPILVGSSEKLHRATGWRPSISFEDMIKLLVQNEMNKLTSIKG